MNKINKLAEQAGFVIWSEGPRKGKVDWACEYDKELAKFAELLVASHEAEARVLKSLMYNMEQPIFQAWAITDDIKIMAEKSADKDDLLALAKVYEYKFQNLWDKFEEALWPTTK
jgi:hypothetical protein